MKRYDHSELYDPGRTPYSGRMARELAVIRLMVQILGELEHPDRAFTVIFSFSDVPAGVRNYHRLDATAIVNQFTRERTDESDSGGANIQRGEGLSQRRDSVTTDPGSSGGRGYEEL